MIRTFIGFMIGLPITFTIFIFMSLLVEAKAARVTPDPPIDPTINRRVLEEKIPIKQTTQLPEKDEVAKQPLVPTTPSDPVENIEGPTQTLPPLNFTGIKVGVIKGPGIPGGANNPQEQGDQDAVPVLISEAQWPANANTSGSVRLCFTITPEGKARNVSVTESSPGRLFVKTAKRAVHKWKFRPAYIGNNAVEQNNMCYTMNFNLED